MAMWKPDDDYEENDLTPMIDIVFLLLVVFIYAMLSMAVHRGMPVKLPTSTTAVLDKTDRLAITVPAQGPIHVNETPVALDRLAAFLERRPDLGPSAMVMVFGDEDLAYQRLFHVLDQCRQAGIDRIALQAEAAPAP